MNELQKTKYGKTYTDETYNPYYERGLTGKIISVRKENMRVGEHSPDQWAYCERKMRVEAEYPRFLVVTVLPAPAMEGKGMAQPLVTTLHKHDIATGEIIIQV